MARVAGLVAAAGSGARLGAGPKAFVTVGGRTLLALAVAAFEGSVDELLVAVPRDAVERVAREYPSVRVVPGGVTRQATVAALARAAACDLVVVHDVARPFLDRGTLRACIEAGRSHGAATVVAEVADTLVAVADGTAVDRTTVRAVQTPQAFDRDLLLRAHAAAEAEGRAATDDAALVRHIGHEVALVAGGAHLFKITTRADLSIARAFAIALEAGEAVAG